MEKKYTLPKEFGEKWVEALRANKTPQITGVFHAVVDGIECFCGNGLAYHANGIEIEGSDIVVYNGIQGSIWNSRNKLPIKEQLVEAIVELNDHKKMSFPQIADWITKNVKFV